MTLQGLSIVLIAALSVAAEASPLAQPQARANSVTVTGRVVEVSGRLLTIREETPGGRELFVLAPRPLSPDLAGATVRAEGTLRQLTAAEVKQSTTSDPVGDQLRARLGNRPVLVATSVAAALEGKPSPESTATGAPPSRIETPEAERQSAAPAPAPPLTIRASMLTADLDGFAGQPVRVLNARVVGILEPGSFLVEPATNFLKDMGTRDRIVVLIQNGELRVPAALAVGETVSVEGIARTLLSMQVTREVPWPARLEPATIKRWEVRAVLLATSVRTAEGTELIAPRTAAVR